MEYFLNYSFKLHVQSMVKPNLKYIYLIHPSVQLNDPIYRKQETPKDKKKKPIMFLIK